MEVLISEFKGLRILVYGDFVLDEFLYGQIDRISREAPVFIVSHETSDFRPGCAANTVANLAALGAEVIPVGIVGDDEYGQKILSIFESFNVSTEYILASKDINTALKTRVIAGGAHSTKQQIVRIDRLNKAKGTGKSTSRVRELLSKAFDRCEALLISDYGIGGLNPELARWALKKNKVFNKPTLVDSRYRLSLYTGATAMTPNQPEAEECLGRRINSLPELYQAGEALRKKFDVEALVITRGSEGMTLFTSNRAPRDIEPFGDEEVVDVTGAGDTVIAAFTLGVAAGADYIDAARIANIAGGLSVLKKGTCTVSAEEIGEALGKQY